MKKIVQFLCFVVVGLLIMPNFSYALSPIPRPIGDAWFTHTITIDQNTLPAGITYFKKGSQYEYTVIVGGQSYLTTKTYTGDTIINTTKVPLALKLNPVLESFRDSFYELVVADVVSYSHLLVSYQDRLDVINELYKDSTRKYDYSWGGLGWTAQGSSFVADELQISDSFLKDFAKVTIHPKAFQTTFEGDRPSNVVVPSPENFVVQAMYNGQPVEIKGAVIYTLNQDYKTYFERNGRLYTDIQNNYHNPPPNPPSFIRNLTIGSTGGDVIELQTILESAGFLKMPQGVARGYFGGLTRKALADYQKHVNITPALGYFGSLTRAKFNADEILISQLPRITSVTPESGPVGTKVTIKGENLKNSQILFSGNFELLDIYREEYCDVPTEFPSQKCRNSLTASFGSGYGTNTEITFTILEEDMYLQPYYAYNICPVGAPCVAHSVVQGRILSGEKYFIDIRPKDGNNSIHNTTFTVTPPTVPTY